MDARSLETRGFDHTEGAAGRVPVKACVTQYWSHKEAIGSRPDMTGPAGLGVSRSDQPKAAADKAPVGIGGSPQGSPPDERADRTRLICRRPIGNAAKAGHGVKNYVATGERADEMD